MWWDLFSSAEQEIGILVYSGLFFADDAGMVELLASRARDGVKVRILLGDPDSPHVKRRSEEEGIGDALAARARNALTLLRPLTDIDGVEIRLHSTVLYNSIYLTEKRALVNQHIYGLPAAKCPTVDVHRTSSLDILEIYFHSFELTWKGAHPGDA